MQSTEQLKIKLEDKSISKEERIGILINLSSNLLQIDLEEALKYNKQADELSIDYPENHIDRGLILNNYGVYYYMINLNEQALAKFIEADKILSQSEQLEHRILSKADIGLIYTRTRQYEEALDIYLQIEKELQLLPISIRHAQMYINIDAAYVYLKDYENALCYSLKALEITEAENHTFGRAIASINSGSNYFKTGNPEKAKPLLDKGKELSSIENKQNSVYVSALMKLADYHFKTKEYDIAFEYSNEALSIAEKMKYYEHAMYICQQQVNNYEYLENYKNAFSILKKYNELKETHLNVENTKIINALQIQYNTEKKELELIELKVKQQQLEIEKRDSELAALKSQMNPHFIFNALNSIQELYTIGDKKTANEQMGNFASLTRKILDVSGKQKIDLSDEIDILTKYLELESIRFEKEFSYQIQVSENTDEDEVQLPPMLIQPYVENAIKHGLLHKKGNKQLDIYFNINEEETLLQCIIDDNGIGRKASAEINKKRITHQSFSTSATEKRLKLLNDNLNNTIAVLFEDKYDEHQQICGTRVTLQISLK
ncbi:MAG: histidine kinase [Chitinophagales bacterium]